MPVATAFHEFGVEGMVKFSEALGMGGLTALPHLSVLHDSLAHPRPMIAPYLADAVVVAYRW